MEAIVSIPDVPQIDTRRQELNCKFKSTYLCTTEPNEQLCIASLVSNVILTFPFPQLNGSKVSLPLSSPSDQITLIYHGRNNIIFACTKEGHSYVLDRSVTPNALKYQSNFKGFAIEAITTRLSDQRWIVVYRDIKTNLRYLAWISFAQVASIDCAVACDWSTVIGIQFLADDRILVCTDEMVQIIHIDEVLGKVKTEGKSKLLPAKKIKFLRHSATAVRFVSWHGRKISYGVVSKGELKIETHSVPLEPIDITLSKFHIVTLYRDYLELLHDETFSSVERVSLTKLRDVPVSIDYSLQDCLIVVFEESIIHSNRLFSETRFLWKFALEKKDFARAFELATPFDRPMVSGIHAEFLFSKAMYREAAFQYAISDLPIENVVALFSRHNLRPLLITYLRRKIETIPNNRPEKHFLFAWLIELFMEALSCSREMIPEFTAFLADTVKSGFAAIGGEKMSNFVFRTLINNGFFDELATFLSLTQNFVTLAELYITRSNIPKALESIASIPDFSKQKTILREHLSVLIDKEPEIVSSLLFQAYSSQEIVDSSDFSFLEGPITSLAPGIIKCLNPAFQSNRAITKIVDLFKRHIDDPLCELQPQFHDIFVFLLIKSDLDAEFHRYFESGNVNCNLETCFRFAKQLGKPRFVIFLLMKMGLKSDAVEFALQNGMINEVLDIVNKQETNPTQKYRLSLKIASFLFKVDKSISFEEKQTRFDSALQILEQLPVLIDDVIELIDDEILIESIQEPLIKALESMDRSIASCAAGISSSNSQISSIQDASATSQTKFVVAVEAEDVCQVCSKSLFDRPFVVYPCRHYLHSACKGNQDGCPLCGPSVIKSIADPFVDTLSSEFRSWSI